MAGITHAQVSGTKTVGTGGDYPSLDSAFYYLNSVGVGTGGVVLNLLDNQTCPIGGYMLGSTVLNATLTSATPIVLNGNAKTITAYAGTKTGSTSTAANDGMIILNGVDYVTINNIVFNELSTNSTTTLAMENAIAMYNAGTAAGTADGCQNISITGCTFNLSNIATNGAAVYCAPYNYSTQLAVAWNGYGTMPSDMHRWLTVTGNNFNNIFNAVYVRGNSSTNMRGVQVDNNTINGIGGGVSTAYGLYGIYVDSILASNNILSGDPLHTSTFYGIFASTNCGGYQYYFGNDVTIEHGATTSTAYGIYSTSIGARTIIRKNNFKIGNLGAITNGSIYLTYTSYSGGNANFLFSVDSNTCINQTMKGTGGMYGFYTSGSSTLTNANVNDNRISSFTRTGASGITYLIYMGSHLSANIFNNVIDTINYSNTSGTSSSTVRPIMASNSSPTQNIYNNLVSNVTFSGSNTAANTIGAIYAYPGANSNVYNNIISNFNSNSVATGAGNYLVYNLASSGANTYGNIIRNVSLSGATGVIAGIYTSAATNINVYNNSISDLKAVTSNNSNAVSGIFIAGGTNVNILHNTIKLAGLTSTGTTYGNSGIYIGSTTPTMMVRNNIINIQGNAGSASGYNIALRRISGTTGTKPSNLTATNNIYYVNPTAKNFIYGEGTSTYTNLYYISGASTGTADPSFNSSCGLYKSWMGELGTFSEDNLTAGLIPGTFVPTGSTYADNNALVTSITTDLSGATRSATPDCGSLEFSATALDASGPVIAYTNIPNTYCTTAPTLTATLTDINGVNNTTGTKPRLYYKKITENNAFGTYPADNISSFNGWKYVEATGSYSFTLDYTKLTSAVAVGDSIHYFVIGQDNVSTPNVGINTASFPSSFCPSSVNLSGASALASTANVKKYAILSAPTITVSSNPKNICVTGTSTLNVSGISIDPNSTFAWTANGTPISGAIASTYTTPTLTVANSGTYYTAQLFCGSNPASNIAGDTVYVVNPQIVSKTTDTICGYGPATIGATGSTGSILNWYNTTGNLLGSGPSYTTSVLNTTTNFLVTAGILGGSNDYTIGTGTTIASSTGQTPFSSAWESQKTQYLIKASEMQAMGMASAGNINSLAFNVTTAPNFYLKGYTIKMANVTDNVLPASYLAPNFTTCYSDSVPSGGALGWKTFPFSLPFQWDGVSNVLVQVCFANDPTGTGGNLYGSNGQVTSTNVGYNAVYAKYADNTNGCGGTPSNTFGNSTTRPNFKFNFASLCESVKDTVKVQVNPAPLTTLVTNPGTTLCFGSPLTLKDSSSNTGYVYTWSNGYIGSTQTINLLSDSTISVVAYDSTTTCIALNSVSINVVPAPVGPLSIAPLADTICSGMVAGPFAITAPAFNNLLSIGTGTTANSISSHPTSFGDYYENMHSQMLIRASELESYGLLQGDTINTLIFDVTTPPSGANPTLDNLKISLGHTTTNALTTSAFLSAPTVVYTSPSYTVSTGLNMLNLTSGFVWDGISNLVVDIYKSDDSTNSSTTSMYTTNSIVNSAATSFASYAYSQTDNSPVGGLAPTATLNSRPNIIFQFSRGHLYSWSPSSTLWLDSTISTAYTLASNSSKVYANPSVTTDYTASYLFANGCSISDTVQVMVNPTPVVNLGPDSSVCAGYILTAGTDTTNSYSWSNASTGLTLVPDTAGTYYVSVTSPASCFASDTVTLTIKPIVSVTGVSWAFTTPGNYFDLTFTANGVSNANTVSWNFGDGNTGTGNPVSHTYTSAGVKTVTVTLSNDCGDTTITLTEVPVSNQIISKDNQLRIYPNPSSSSLNIESINGVNIEGIILINAIGQTVSQVNSISARQLELNVANLADGVYMIRIITSQGDIIQTIQVKH